jgi:hypothetical protein
MASCIAAFILIIFAFIVLLRIFGAVFVSSSSRSRRYFSQDGGDEARSAIAVYRSSLAEGL